MGRIELSLTALPASQAQAIDALSIVADVPKAAAVAGVDPDTLRGWLSRDAEFIAGLNLAKAERVERLRSEVRELASVALSTLRELLSAPETSPAVRLRAAMAVLAAADATTPETIGPTDAADIRRELSRRDLFASLGV